MRDNRCRLAIVLAALAVTILIVPCAEAQTSSAVLERATQKFADARFDEVIGLLEPERVRPYPPEMVYRLLASAYLMEGKHGKALDAAQEGSGHYPRSVELQVLLVDALSRDQPDKALQELQRIISDIDSGGLFTEHFSVQELEMFQAQIHSLAGRNALEKGQHDKAIAHFEAVAELQPMEPSAHHQLLYAYLKAEAFQDLLDAYDRVPSWLQSDRTMITLRSQALLELRDVGELSEIYRKLHEENPDDLELAMTYGQLLMTDGQVLKANELFNEILQKHPEDRRVYEVLMDINRRQFNYEGMATLLKEMIRNFPEDLEPSLELAQIRGMLGKTDEAVAIYDSLIYHRGSEYRFVRKKAALLHRTGNLDEAYRTVNNMAREFADDPGDPGESGIVTDDTDEALRDYDLALLTFQKGDPAAAAPLLQSYLRSHPQDSLAWMMTGRVQEALGASAEALNHYQRASEKGVVWPEMYKLLLDDRVAGSLTGPEVVAGGVEDSGIEDGETALSELLLQAFDHSVRDIRAREGRLRLAAQFTLYGQPVDENQPFYPADQQLRDVKASYDRLLGYVTEVFPGHEIRRALDDLMELHPEDAMVYETAANYFEKSGDPVHALQFYIRAAEIDPGDSSVHMAIGGIMEEREDWGSAVLWYERALSAGAPATVYGSLIRVHRENGSLDQLVERWLVRYRSQRTDEQFREYLIDALHRSGRREEAREIARQR